MEKIKYFKVKDNANNSKFDFKQILKGVVVGTASALFFLLIAAAILTYTDISMSLVNIISNIAFYFGALFSGFMGSRKLKSYGWLNGMLSGGIYSVMIFFINILSDMNGIKAGFPFFKILLAVLIGAIGGIVGVNIQLSGNKRK